MDRRFHHIRVAISSLRESMRGIDFDVHNVIAGRHTSNVDPLTA